MQPRDHLAAARRWAKFPATVLFVTGVLWLLLTYFRINWAEIGETTETGIGALYVFTDMVVIPLGSLVIGVCVMFLQRWALWGTGVILAVPLVQSTLNMAQRVDHKFDTYHLTRDVQDFGAGIMTAIEILGIWVIYAVVVYHLRKALYWHGKARQWVRKPLTEPTPADHVDKPVPPRGAVARTDEDGDVCLLMPDFYEEEGE